MEELTYTRSPAANDIRELVSPQGPNLIEFQIGQVFPSDDPVTGWIIGLAMAHNDVIFTNALYLQIEDDPALEGERLYLVRVSASHIREALAFLWQWDGVAEVPTFRESLSEQAQESYLWLRSLWDPWEPSFLRNYLAPIRNQVFHYPEDPAEIETALDSAKNVKSGIDMRGGTAKDLRALFADEVAIRLAFGHLFVDSSDDWEHVYRALVSVLADTVGKS